MGNVPWGESEIYLGFLSWGGGGGDLDGSLFLGGELDCCCFYSLGGKLYYIMGKAWGGGGGGSSSVWGGGGVHRFGGGEASPAPRPPPFGLIPELAVIRADRGEGRLSDNPKRCRHYGTEQIGKGRFRETLGRWIASHTSLSYAIPLSDLL